MRGVDGNVIKVRVHRFDFLAVGGQSVAGAQIGVGDNLEIKALLSLAGVSPTDIRVEACYGPMDSKGNFLRSKVLFLNPVGDPQDGRQLFAGNIQFRTSGSQGLSIRVMANHEDVLCAWDYGFVTWAG